jgi:hypothetical protein
LRFDKSHTPVSEVLRKAGFFAQLIRPFGVPQNRFGLLLLPLLIAGCTHTLVQNPMTQATARIKDPLSSQMEFWHGLTDQPVTCNDDAFHGLLLFLDGNDPKTRYADRVTVLKSRKLIPGYFNGPANEAVQRGTIAFAFVQALHIQGGWVMTVFGDSPRYAVRELEDLNLYPRSSPEQTFSGSEFVGVIGRAEDYQRGESAFVPAPIVTPHGTGD